MVFKVKQRAAKNYNHYRNRQIAAAIRQKYEVPAGFGRKMNNDSATGFDTSVLENVTYSDVYGSNWPYDFFSLIETIKLDIQLKVES